MTEVRIEPHFDAWRDAARHLLLQHRPPGRVLWVERSGSAQAQPLLPGLTTQASPSSPEVLRVAKRGGVRVPPAFLELARRVACHRDSDRWALLYRVLWRLVTSEPDLLGDAADPDVRRLTLLGGQVARDVHKMHAFVRFRKVSCGLAGPAAGGGAGGVEGRGERFVAWYEPDHRIVRLAAPFFAERFASLDWAILTPDESAVFDGGPVRFGPGVPRSAAPSADELEGLWCTYYASIFNPARVKVAAMTREMPRRFWRNLPETAEVHRLVAEAPARAAGMVRRGQPDAAAAPQTAAAFVPATRPGQGVPLPQLAAAAAGCRGCELCQTATQTVFGEGPPESRLVLVGEQPGDEEDRLGRPFVGPAGQVLDRALADAGLDRTRVYITNAVKHFHHQLRGARRIHARPAARHLHACRPWLVAELAALRPAVVVALGNTAAQAMLGPTFRLTECRGQVYRDTEWAPAWLATLHPSAVLRTPDPAAREQAYATLVADLRYGAGLVRQP